MHRESLMKIWKLGVNSFLFKPNYLAREMFNAAETQTARKKRVTELIGNRKDDLEYTQRTIAESIHPPPHFLNFFDGQYNKTE